MVDAGSEACIEGFPRSGNTLAVHAFVDQNPGVRLAHHVHLPAQVEKAVRSELPCAVLIRDPVDTLTSLMIFADERLSIGLATRIYVDFHRRMWKLRERIAVIDFSETIADPTIVPRRLNRVFGTAFRADPMSPGAVRELVGKIEREHVVSAHRPGSFTVPLAEKDRRKPSARERLAGHRLMPEAVALYERLRAYAGEGG
jgi:hypothetical protein